ncbi:MAG: RHS repeat domain-containing protein [Nitrospirales bacterium]
MEDPEGGITEYTYDGSGRMYTVKDARGIVFLPAHGHQPRLPDRCVRL